MSPLWLQARLLRSTRTSRSSLPACWRLMLYVRLILEFSAGGWMPPGLYSNLKISSWSVYQARPRKYKTSFPAVQLKCETAIAPYRCVYRTWQGNPRLLLLLAGPPSQQLPAHHHPPRLSSARRSTRSSRHPQASTTASSRSSATLAFLTSETSRRFPTRATWTGAASRLSRPSGW